MSVHHAVCLSQIIIDCYFVILLGMPVVVQVMLMSVLLGEVDKTHLFMKLAPWLEHSLCDRGGGHKFKSSLCQLKRKNVIAP